MAANSVTCIYCPKAFDPDVGEGDHVLPLAFGDFDGAIKFRGVCPGCNNKLSPLEEEVLRTAPEAVLRRFAGSATNRRGKAIGWQAASGTPPPRFLLKHADHDQLLEGDPSIGGQSRPVDHLAVVLKDGRNVHIRLVMGMSADALRRKLKQQGVADGDIATLAWHAAEENADSFVALFREVWPSHHHEERAGSDAGMHRVRVRIECTVTSRYFRAIAKIAFHYFLANSRCGFTGHEDCFKPIRAFIMDGGQPEAFLENQKLDVVLPVGTLADGTALLPARWMHVLSCVESLHSVVVGVYTLFGPERPPAPHFVTIHHRPGLAHVPEFQYGHAYIHGNRELGDSRAAFVVPIQIGRIG